MERLFRLCFLLTLACGVLKANAGIDKTIGTTNKGEITATTVVTVTDDKFGKFQAGDIALWNSITNISVKNSVYVKLLDDQLLAHQEFKVELDIETFSGGSGNQETKTFNVYYDPAGGKTYRLMDVYEFTGAYKIIVRNIRISYLNGGPVPLTLTKSFEVGATVFVNRKYSFQPNAEFVVLTSPRKANDTEIKEQLLLEWTFLAGDEEVDIEWATVDNGSKGKVTLQAMIDAGTGDVSSTINLDELFRNNATRVTLDQDKKAYPISLLYNNDYLVFRIRRVQYDENGLRLTSKWYYKSARKSAPDQVKYSYLQLDWNEPKLNWQYSASFAEDGKKKEVISYFDGSLRNRQTVTLSNANNVAVAQEDIYDEFGRKTASVLPGIHKEEGTSSPFLHFIPNFNVNAANRPYSASDIFANYANCDPIPQALSVLSGAANYYSTRAGLAGSDRYLPDAEGYPIAVTQYTPDNTGRLKMQGGVGRAFQPGISPQHTTRYFYGKPEQWELDQLFGNDVGYAEHYLKNMVIDPNGQISISYLNGSGKTIATALAGDNPQNTEVLPEALLTINKGVEEKVTRIFKPEQFVFDGDALKLTATTTYVESSVEHNITLAVNIPQILYCHPVTPNFCANCYYKLDIAIKDDCGNVMALPGFTGSRDIGARYLQQLAAAPAPITGIDFDHPGEYYITITLTYDKDAVAEYADAYMTHAVSNDILKKKFEYIKENFLAEINASGCYSDCKTCELALGTLSSFRAMVDTKFLEYGIDGNSEGYGTWADGLYNSLKSQCTSLQATCNPCSLQQNDMLTDISPNGQYALYDANNLSVEPAVNELHKHFNDVFGPSKLPNRELWESEYISTSDGRTISVYSSGFNEALMVQYWNPLWASRFLQYHPEYCKLQFCNSNADAYRWDDRVALMTKATDAGLLSTPVNSNAYDESKYNLLLNLDPFFNAGAGAAYKPAMLTDLQHYSKNIVFNNPTGANTVLNQYNEKNIAQYVSYQLYCQPANGEIDKDVWNNCAVTSECRAVDREWRAYVALYLKLKKKYYEQANDCNGGCNVGPAITSPPPVGCPQPMSFSVEKTDCSNCGMDEQAVKFTYAGGKLSTAITLNYYYPGLAGYQASVNIPANNSSATITVPKGLNYKQIKIVSVDCQNYSQGKCVTLTRRLYIARGDLQTFPGGSYIKNTHRIEANLWKPYGTPAYATAPVQIQLEFERQHSIYESGNTTPISTTSYEIRTVTIAVGRSDVDLPYIDVDVYLNASTGNYEMDYFVFKNGYSITGANFCTSTNTCEQLYAYKTSRFPKETTVPVQAIGNIADMTNEAALELEKEMREIAEVQADGWIANLKPGVIAVDGSENQVKITELKNRLVDVYVKGSSLSGVIGASTVNINTTAADHSFEEVIGDMFYAGNTTAFRPDLNPWLISGVFPHDKQPKRTPNIISRTNTGICAKLMAIKSNYLLSVIGDSYSLTNFYTYLKETYGADAVTFSQAEMEKLMQACESTNGCNLLKEDITLPEFLNPDKGCITRAELTAAISEMNGRFVPALTTSDPNYSAIFTNYLNSKWGFALTYQQYQDFLGSQQNNMCSVPDYTSASGDPDACIKAQFDGLLSAGTKAYNEYLAAARAEFIAAYVKQCSLAQITADMKVKPLLYHYTLYYYDQADNLVRTVPPEGVTLLDKDQIAKVQQLRNAGDPAGCQINYNGPLVAASATAANTDLRNTLAANGNRALELWFKDLGEDGKTTLKSNAADYALQLEWVGKRLHVAVFSDVAPNGNYRMTNKVSLDLTNLPPFNDWTHIVVQSTNLAHDPLQVYINGVSPAKVSAIPMVAGPVNLSALKHLRLYNRLLNDREIITNATNQCFATLITAQAWYRFNLPEAGGEGTIGDASTIENNITYVYPDHKLTTTYAYNSTNQVLKQVSPDGGVNRFWYDWLARLSVSQNDKQLNHKYSYTTYDALGRIEEVGQKDQNQLDIGEPGYLTSAVINDFKTKGTDTEITHTYYDVSAPAGNGITAITQSNLRKRVAATTYADDRTGGVLRATYYDYDISGNVKTFWQHIDGLTNATDANTLKRIDYEYDLIAGKVNFVRYQHNKPDAFYYSYNYDAENRLTEAWSGIRAMVDEHLGSQLLEYNSRRDAAYRYYLHGPLARMELGDELALVQGVDYAYTLQGWLKGVNSTTVEQSADMGGDGTAVPKDAFGYQLTYYGTGPDVANPVSDYKPVSTAVANPFDPRVAGLFSYNHNGLYNGNIAAMTVRVPVLGAGWMTNLYKYDQLNRIRNSATYNAASLAQGALQYGWGYNESFTYDGNGNILTSNRTDANMGAAVFRDNLIYTYNKDGNGRLISNQLKQVQEYAADDNNNSNELKNGFINYTYDAIGNIINETHTGTGGKNINYDWTVYGKLKSVNGTNVNISYGYNSSGQRTSQTNTNSGITTYYVRDAQGNPLAVYSKNPQGIVTWKEQQLYGSSRLGMWQPEAVVATDDALAKWNLAGKKRYELSNHLGNVLATISDRRLQLTTNNNTVSGYNADVINAQDYYAFGGLKPNRNYTAANATAYRYGFNGKENDNEVKGEGNEQDYGMRIYDPRLGRFLSVDPLTKEYPWYTPYSYAGNMPIRFIDMDGLEQAPPRFYFEPMKYSGKNTVGDYLKTIPNAATGAVNGVISLLYDAGDFVNLGTSVAQHGELPFSYKDIKKEFANIGDNFKQNLKNSDWSWSAFVRGIKDPETYQNTLEMGGALYTMSRPVLKKPSVTVGPTATLEEVTLKNTTAQLGEAFKNFAISIKEGKINISNRSVTNGTFDFIIDNNGSLKIGTGHYNLSDGAESVQAAGTLSLYKGKVTRITNSSGHYQPTISQGQSSVGLLKKAGVDVQGADVKLYNTNGKLEQTYRAQ